MAKFSYPEFLEAIDKVDAAFKSLPPSEVFVIHPDNEAWLLKELGAIKATPREIGILCHSNLFGVQIRFDPLMPRMVPTGKRIIPPDRFIEYEESDLIWAEPLGMTADEMVPAIWRVDTSLNSPTA